MKTGNKNRSTSAPVTSTAAPAAPQSTDAPSAAPGTTEAKAKKEKVEKVQYVPTVGAGDWVNADGKLTAWPGDFDPKTHKPPQRKDYADDAVFFTILADRAEASAKKFREKAEESKKLGNVKDRARAKKLLAARKRMQDLEAQLKAEGVNVEELLGTLGDVAK